MNGLRLSEKEKKWLTRLESDDKGSILRYVVGVILICISFYYLVLAGKYIDIHKAMLYGTLGGVFIVVQYTYKIYYKIIKKMKDYIEDIERRNNSS